MPRSKDHPWGKGLTREESRATTEPITLNALTKLLSQRVMDQNLEEDLRFDEIIDRMDNYLMGQDPKSIEMKEHPRPVKDRTRRPLE